MKTTTILVAFVFALSSMASFAQKADVIAKDSKIKWIGEKIGGGHEGFIKVKNGQVEMKDGDITAGSFTIDMTTISCTDLKNAEYNQKLVGHLNSDDFFSVAKFPEAKFEITEANVKNGKGTVKGLATIKGITKAISFPVEKSGNDYTAKIEIDRSEFDVRYGSKSFFEGLGDNVIDDIFTLNVLLVLDSSYTTTMK